MDELFEFAESTGMRKDKKLIVKTACVVQAYNFLNLCDLFNYVKDLDMEDWRMLERLDFDLDLNPRDSELHQDTYPFILDLGLERFKATGHRQVDDFVNFVAQANRVDEMEFKNHLLSATVNYDTRTNYKTLDPISRMVRNIKDIKGFCILLFILAQGLTAECKYVVLLIVQVLTKNSTLL